MSLRIFKKYWQVRWNFAVPAPLYLPRSVKLQRTVLVLRSLSAPSGSTDLLERFSSLPLLFVSGRFATFLFPSLPRGGQP